MVISAQVLSINIGGSSSSNGNSNNKRAKSGLSNKNNTTGTTKIAVSDEIENQEDQEGNRECSINSSITKTPSTVWFRNHQSQQHPKWLLNCCSSDLAAQQLTVLIDSIGGCIPDPIVATPSTSIASTPTAADRRNTTTVTTAVSPTVPETITQQDMSRESRHVHVIGLPDSLSDERVASFFST